MADDPFTQTLDKIWDLLESHTGFTDLVRLGNRIKVSGTNPDPYKPRPQSADLPEVRVEPEGGKVELFATSSSSRATQDYAVSLVTGDVRVNKQLFPLKWEMMKALSKSGDNLGLSFVTKVRVREVGESVGQEDHRVKRAWSGKWIISVEMWFANSQLQV